jgi:glutamate N-acetyltransferase/amino-acid N-acetyltransferase
LRAVVVNSGCSNVATGRRGISDARTMCARVSSLLQTRASQVVPLSTGIIGEFLPMDRIRRGIDKAFEKMSSSETAGRRFAKAILTTDTRVKQACERFTVRRNKVTVAGCCKGSGMIAPNMATMLGFITTDADLNKRSLQKALREAVEPTFNRVTIDECQSTSDAVIALASGYSSALTSKASQASFASAMRDVCESLAQQLVEDGEGATRFVEVHVKGAKTAQDAHTAARAIATSPLVKTAVNGGDPNWGRIIQALGATSVTFRPERVVVKLGRTTIFTRGCPAPKLDHAKLVKLMNKHRIVITAELHAGKASDRVLTADLSREYVTINADYHT